MSNQTMMLDVPPGTEPVSGRSLAADEPKTRKAPRKDRARGVVRINHGGEELIIMMRPDKLIVRRPGKRHRDERPIGDVIDYVIGQGDLFKHTVDESVIDALIELAAAIKQDSPLLQFALDNACAVCEQRAPEKFKESLSV